MSDEQIRQDDILQDTDRPDVGLLIRLYEGAKNDLAGEFSYYKKMQNVRYCRWPGQNLEDGKKHGDKDRRAFPWEGASDLRTFAVDDCINSLAASAMTSMYRARIWAAPRNGADCERAASVAQFVEWYFKAAIPDARRELELWLQWGLTQGKSVLGVFWERIDGFGTREVSAADAAGASNAIGDFLISEDSPEPSREAVNDAMSAYDFPSESKAEKFLTDLKAFGAAVVRTKKVVADRARFKALRVGVDFFCPGALDSLDSAPCAFVREFLTVSDFRARAAARSWSKAFTTAALAAPAEGAELPNAASYVAESPAMSVSSGYPNGRVEVVTAYYKTHDASSTVSLRYCVFSPSADSVFAESGEFDAAGGRLPFVVYARETVERQLLDSRGIAEVAEGWQREIKTQKDARIDRTSLELNPPKLYRAGRKPTEFKPAAWIPVNGADFKIIEEVRPAGNVNASFNAEEQIANEMSAYFGLKPGGEADPAIAGKKQAFIDSFFACVAKALELVYLLYGKFGQDKTLFPPVGEPAGTVAEYQNAAEDEDFTFALSFDARDENFDLFLKKFDVASKFIGAFDTSGSVNTSRLLKRLLGVLFPDEVRDLISSPQDSDRREILETQSDLAAIYSAQPVNAPTHCNSQLRLQIVSDYVQTPSIAARMQTDKDFADALQNYAKQLQFQIQQARNALTGRYGAEPAPGAPANLEGEA